MTSRLLASIPIVLRSCMQVIVWHTDQQKTFFAQGEFYGVSVRVHREDDGTIVVVPNRTTLR